MAEAASRFAPDLILAIGGFHVPGAFLARLAALPGRPPLAAWVGDVFDNGARAAAAALYDLVAYTDSRMLARHAELGFASKAIFLPHAANSLPPPPPRPRAPRMVFVGAATPGRRAAVRADHLSDRAIRTRLDRPTDATRCMVDASPTQMWRGLYAGHLAALNIRNETNVLSGLNQRSFDPYLSATPVVSDDQDDLARCFEPGLGGARLARHRRTQRRLRPLAKISGGRRAHRRGRAAAGPGRASLFAPPGDAEGRALSRARVRWPCGRRPGSRRP